MLRLLVAMVVVLLGGVIASASGATSTARSTAEAVVVSGTIGATEPVRAEGDQRRRTRGAVALAGVSVGTGDALAQAAPADPNEDRQSGTHARAVARSVSLLAGLVTADAVRRSAASADGEVTYDGEVRQLRIAGEPVGDVSEGRSFELPEGAGTVVVNVDGRGLELRLDQPLAGLPAGTVVTVAQVSASAPAPEPSPTATPAPTATPTPTPTPTPSSSSQARRALDAAEPPRRSTPDGAARRPVRDAQGATLQRLTRGSLAFPIYGGGSVSDGFGAARHQGPHEGNDVFAAFGAPVLAVADGTIEKVGTLPISGNRLWLRTSAGDAFFYAHLSAFAPAAINGRRVTAGTVLGFVGNTGDAELTPPHVHFEIHPHGGPAVDPYPVLRAWQQAAPARSDDAWLTRYGEDTQQRPGALVPVRDFISDE